VVALKKKLEAKAKGKRLGKDDQAAGKTAPTKGRAVKAPKKSAAKSGASRNKAKRNSEKQGKIRIPDADEQSPLSGVTAPEPDPFEVAKRTMKGSVPAIVEAMVELAKQGSCSHAKTLLEMTGAKHMFDGEAERECGEPWAKLVLERLGEEESLAEQETVSSQEESIKVLTER
jgi:hypothetical protein